VDRLSGVSHHPAGPLSSESIETLARKNRIYKFFNEPLTPALSHEGRGSYSYTPHDPIVGVVLAD